MVLALQLRTRVNGGPASQQPPGLKETQRALEVPFVKAPEPASYGANKVIAKRELQDINDLKAMSSAELQELFANGRAPDPRRFSGEMRGVALAAPHHDTSMLGRFVNWVMTKIPPWAGKNALTQPGEAISEGTGKNRIFGGLLCPFQWNVVDSKLDTSGSRVIRLDYATPKSLLNTVTGISAVHDEIREVGAPGSGVYLGLAGLAHNGPISSGVFNGLLRLAGREERVSKDAQPVPIIYFALQAR